MSGTRFALGALSTLLLVTSAVGQPARQQNSMTATASGSMAPPGTERASTSQG